PLDPVTLSAGLKRDGALYKTDSSGPRWRVLIVTLVLSRPENCRLQQQQDCRCKTCNGKSCAYVFHKGFLAAAIQSGIRPHDNRINNSNSLYTSLNHNSHTVVLISTQPATYTF